MWPSFVHFFQTINKYIILLFEHSTKWKWISWANVGSLSTHNNIVPASHNFVVQNLESEFPTMALLLLRICHMTWMIWEELKISIKSTAKWSSEYLRQFLMYEFVSSQWPSVLSIRATISVSAICQSSKIWKQICKKLSLNWVENTPSMFYITYWGRLLGCPLIREIKFYSIMMDQLIWN